MLWLIGSGAMAVDYSKVLTGLSCEYVVVGRSESGAQQFKAKTGVEAFSGGVELFLDSKPSLPESAIVCVSVEQLAPVARCLVRYGVKRILLEKPGGVSSAELSELHEFACGHGAEIYLAYNRRHYSSVQAIKKYIDEDGGVLSFNFEITEWSHIISSHNKDLRAMNSWFLGNTSHVIDTAFFLCGQPRELASFHSGGISWHPASSNFSGAGVSESGALFSYYGNWEAPGRWSIEVLTRKRKYILRPMEKLHIQNIGSVSIEPLEVSGSKLDISYKPGLYRQVEKFLCSDMADFCCLEEQVVLARMYERMAGY